MKRYPQRQTPELFPGLVDLLLEGWGGPRRPEQDGFDPFRIFDYTDARLGEVWRRHRSTLMREAAKRGIREPWGLQFDVLR